MCLQASPADRAAFVGWHRRESGSPWRQAVTAQTEAECWVQLLGFVEGGDKAVLPTGKDPNLRPQREAS